MSTRRHTVIRSLHDLGGAAWFGGALMGAVALNGASQDIKDPTDRACVAAAGWARWSPVAAAGIAAHLIGGAGLTLVHRDRVHDQAGVTANTAAKTIITVAALGTTAYSGVLGGKIAKAGTVPAAGGTQPAVATPDSVAKAQQQLRALQWATPALTGALIVLGAHQGEMQRPGERLRGMATKAQRRATARFTS